MTPETAFDPGIWIADPVHSHVGFAVRHMSLSTYRGRLKDFEANLRVDERQEPSLAGRGRIDLGGEREVRVIAMMDAASSRAACAGAASTSSSTGC